MNYVVILIFSASLLPGFLPDINLGIVYLSVLRAGLLLLPVCYWYKHRSQNKAERYYLKESNAPCIIMMILWFVYSLVTSIWAKDISSWIHMEYFLGMAVWCTVFFDMAKLTDQDYKHLFCISQIILGAHHIIGWYELISHNYFFATEEKVAYMTQYRAFAPISMFYNLNDYALVIACGTFISLFALRVCKHKVMKLFSAAMIISSLSLIVISKSRGCLIALLLGLMVYLLFVTTKEQKKWGILIGLLLGGFILIVHPTLLTSIVAKLSSILNFDFSHGMNSEMVRVNLIRNGFAFLEKTVGFGIGTGNIEYWMENFPEYYTRGYVNMHNWWMEILTNFGILIFSCYIAAYVYLIVKFYKKIKYSQSKLTKEISLVFLSWLAAYAVGSVSSSNNFNVEWIWIFWALAIAYLGVHDKAMHLRGVD